MLCMDFFKCMVVLRLYCVIFFDYLQYYYCKFRIKLIFVENVKICGNLNLWLELVDMLLLIQICYNFKFFNF